MCGRFGFTAIHKLKDYYDLNSIPFVSTKRYNIAPGQTHPIVYGEEKREVELMKWGLIPHWATDPSIGYKMINARAETVAEKPSFKSSLAQRRCLIPASFFYEWKQIGSEKIPYLIRLKETDIFSLAGIYDIWQDPITGEMVKTFTVITTEPNELVAPIHNRMPVIIDVLRQESWLKPTTDNKQLTTLFNPFPIDLMEAYSVSKLVNNPEHDTEAVTKQIFNKSLL